MTGTLKVVGGRTLRWDTDQPASVEAAMRVFEEERSLRNAVAFSTATRPAERIRGPYMPETAHTEVVILRPFQGG